MTSYRREPLRCPQCGSVMQERETAHAVVDVCGQCSGIWVDWFDGEMVQVAKETGTLPSALPHTVDGGSGQCPSCRAPLAVMRYLDEERGARVLRCGDCAGAFVPRSSLSDLLSMSPADVAQPDDDPGLLERLTARLRSLFGWDSE